jgi:hypothetical protein
MAIIYYEHQDPQGTGSQAIHCYHQINPHKVTAMASSTLERLIVDY